MGADPPSGHQGQLVGQCELPAHGAPHELVAEPHQFVVAQPHRSLFQVDYSMIIMTSIWHFALAVPDHRDPKHCRIGADCHRPIE